MTGGSWGGRAGSLAIERREWNKRRDVGVRARTTRVVKMMGIMVLCCIGWTAWWTVLVDAMVDAA